MKTDVVVSETPRKRDRIVLLVVCEQQSKYKWQQLKVQEPKQPPEVAAWKAFAVAGVDTCEAGVLRCWPASSGRMASARVAPERSVTS